MNGENISVDWRNNPKSPSVVGVRLVLAGQDEHIPGGPDFAERLAARIAAWINEHSVAGKSPLIIRDSDRFAVDMLCDSERDDRLDRIQLESAFAAQALGYSSYEISTGNGKVEVDRSRLYHDSTLDPVATSPGVLTVMGYSIEVKAGDSQRETQARADAILATGRSQAVRTSITFDEQRDRRPTGKRAQRRAGKEWNR